MQRKNRTMKKRYQRFKKPTPEEITEYAAQTYNWKMDGEKFWAYYESKGWKVGTSPMKSWQAAVLTWYKNAKARGEVRKAVVTETKTANTRTAAELISEIEAERTRECGN